MTEDEQIRRATVRLWRWSVDRDKAPGIEEMLKRWPGMRECTHPDMRQRSSRNSEGVVLHVECPDCPKSAMRLVRPEELVWPGEEFWELSGNRPAWAHEQ